MSTTIDIAELVKKSMEESGGAAPVAILTAMGGTDIPAAGVPHDHGTLTNDQAALLQATSAAGVPQVTLPSTSFDKPPTTPGM